MNQVREATQKAFANKPCPVVPVHVIPSSENQSAFPPVVGVPDATQKRSFHITLVGVTPDSRPRPVHAIPSVEVATEFVPLPTATQSLPFPVLVRKNFLRIEQMNPTFSYNNKTIVAAAGGGDGSGNDTNTLAYTIINNDEPSVSLTRSSVQFMRAPTTTYNIQSNGGFTAMARVRFMDTLVNERIFDFGKLTTPPQPGLWVAVGSGSNTIAYSSDGVSWTAVPGSTSIFSSFGLGVAYNGTDRWVAVGQGTNSIATSTNGVNWTPLGTGIFSDFGSDVAYNGTRWVAVGAGSSNRIAYSDDGVNWTGLGLSIFNIPSGSAQGRGVTWAGSLWVAVGNCGGVVDPNANTLGYSLDGVNWTGLGKNVFTTTGYEIAWNGSNRLVAVGQGSNSIAYSDNGINWTGLGTGIFNFYGSGIAYNGTDRWVAVGYGSANTIAYSADGINWTPVPNSTSIFTVRGEGVAWNGIDRWVAVGQGGNSIAYSADGINWTGLGTGTFSAGVDVAFNISSAAPVPSDLITLTRASAGTSFQAWIMNGDSFTATLTGGTIVQNQWTNLVMRYTLATNTFQLYQNGVLVASQLVGSPLTNRTLDLNYLGYNMVDNLYSSIDYAGLFVYDSALSDSEIATCFDYIQGRAMYTPNGPKFALIARNLGLTNNANVSAWGESVQFTQSIPANQPVFWRQLNNWVGLGTTVFSQVNDIAYARNRWVATGKGTNTLAFSNDGINWIGLGSSVFSTSGNGVSSSNVLWVAGGEGTNSLVYSVDAITWTGLGSTYFDICYETAWNAVLNRWVAVGNKNSTTQNNSMAYSSDGVNWTIVASSPFTGTSGSSGYCVSSAILANGATHWVAGGQKTSPLNNTLAYSTNGITWTGVGSSIFSDYCFGVAWNGRLWVAVGRGDISNNSIATSTDGINWTGRGSPAGVSIGRRVAWADTYWIVVGEPASGGNCLAISYDGIVWTGITRQGLFTTKALSVASNGS